MFVIMGEEARGRCWIWCWGRWIGGGEWVGAGQEGEGVRAGGEVEWRYNLEPDMHLWWGRGIEWVKRIVGEGTEGMVRFVGGDVGEGGKDKEGGGVGEGGEGKKGGASGEGLFEVDGAYMGEEGNKVSTGLGEMGIENGVRWTVMV